MKKEKTKQIFLCMSYQSLHEEQHYFSIKVIIFTLGGQESQRIQRYL